MKRCVLILALIILGKINSESMYVGIEINENNQKSLGFEIKITPMRRSYRKNCNLVIIKMPTKAKKDSFHLSTNMERRDADKTTLSLNVEPTDEEDYHRFVIVVDKADINKYHFNATYEVPEEESEVECLDSEQFNYEIALRDFKVKPRTQVKKKKNIEVKENLFE